LREPFFFAWRVYDRSRGLGKEFPDSPGRRQEPPEIDEALAKAKEMIAAALGT
jgi:hypothetical protein